MNYQLKEIRTELRKQLLDIDTMIKWNDFLDLVEQEEKPRKVYVFYGMELGKPSKRTKSQIERLGIIFKRKDKYFTYTSKPTPHRNDEPSTHV